MKRKNNITFALIALASILVLDIYSGLGLASSLHKANQKSASVLVK